ncbi:endonuclease/exonuclease/phosphatase family protein [Pedobacter sp. P351]|uniref:endonuclease/exonuclease/phosphatase family protein n=1 Tax=Pedobacter superstes TaxID=3133441 RepID=UPI00309C9344
MRVRSTKKKPGWLQRTLFVLNILASLMLVLSYLASFISPTTFWPIAFIGLAYPALLLFNIFFAVFWLFKKPLFALVPIITILLGWKFLVSTIGFREQNAIQVPKSSKAITRIMSWNVHYFKRFESSNETSVRDQMMDIIRKEQPDILCIQEFFTRRKGEFNFKKAITELLNSQHYYIVELAGNDYEMNGYAIFSKIPIINRGKLSFPTLAQGNDVLFADFKIKNKNVRIYSTHLQSISFQPEDYEYLKSVKEINTDVNSTKRLSRRIKNAFIKRSEQVKILKEHAEKSDMPYIIAGDFNDTPISYAVNTLAKGMKNSFREKGSGFGITYNGDFPNFQIDYILTSQDFEIHNYIIIDKKLSDHYPVRCDLELKP